MVAKGGKFVQQGELVVITAHKSDSYEEFAKAAEVAVGIPMSSVPTLFRPSNGTVIWDHLRGKGGVEWSLGSYVSKQKSQQTGSYLEWVVACIPNTVWLWLSYL